MKVYFLVHEAKNTCILGAIYPRWSMKNGCLPLTKDQIQAVTDALDSGTYALRNQVLFLMGFCYTGFRIAELLSLKVVNVAGGRLPLIIGTQWAKLPAEGFPFIRHTVNYWRH